MKKYIFLLFLLACSKTGIVESDNSMDLILKGYTCGWTSEDRYNLEKFAIMNDTLMRGFQDIDGHFMYDYYRITEKTQTSVIGDEFTGNTKYKCELYLIDKYHLTMYLSGKTGKGDERWRCKYELTRL
jgi:hypothetical protein